MKTICKAFFTILFLVAFVLMFGEPAEAIKGFTWTLGCIGVMAISAKALNKLGCF